MRKLLFRLLLIGISLGCQPASTDTVGEPDVIEQKAPSSIYGEQQQQISQEEVPQQFEVEEEIEDKADCDFEDGTHPATVGYYNPDTGHTATYDLEVHVANCAVVRIDFPNGGWLDEDHIPATVLDSRGNAKLTDVKGRRWEVHVQKK